MPKMPHVRTLMRESICTGIRATGYRCGSAAVILPSDCGNKSEPAVRFFLHAARVAICIDERKKG